MKIQNISHTKDINNIEVKRIIYVIYLKSLDKIIDINKDY